MPPVPRTAPGLLLPGAKCCSAPLVRPQIVISWEKKYDGDQLLHPAVLAPEHLPAGIGQVGGSPGPGWGERVSRG